MLLAAMAVIGGPPATAQDPDDGLRFLSGWTFRIDPDAGLIRVSVRLDITNEVAPVHGAYSVRHTYLPEIAIPVLSEATAVHAVRESDGAALPSRVEPAGIPQVSFVVVDLQPDLHYRDNAVVRIDYDLPGQAPRSSGLTRVNSAFAALIPLFIGDPGLVDLEIVVPKGFEIEFVGDVLDETERGDEMVYTARQIPDPNTFDAAVVLRRDDALITRTVRTGDDEVEVRGWPDDQEWTDFVAQHVVDGVPALEELIGVPLPVDDLQITETIAPYLYGYAGWYSGIDHTIEVGEELDAVVVLHELSHAWFNDEWFAERWIGEAFAEEYASRALVELGSPITGPGAVLPDDPGRFPLAEWPEPLLLDETSGAQERYGYNTSWAVLRTVTDEIGMDAMRDVLAAIDGRTIAYRGDPDPERWSRPTDWRRLLDLLQDVGGSQLAEGVFRDLVVGERSLPSFDERTFARVAYADLGAVGEGWTQPLAVRRLMSEWRFDLAVEAMRLARAALDERAAIAEALAPHDASLEGMEAAYESARDVRALRRVASDWRDASDELGDAAAAADDPGGLLATVGLLGSGPDDELDTAIEAFEAGDLDAFGAAIDDVNGLVDGADQEGLRRLSALFAAVLLVAVARRVVPEFLATLPTGARRGRA